MTTELEIRLRWLVLSLCLSGTVALAQDSGAVPVLHVYANVVQVPVLVLSSTGEHLTDPIDVSRFSISIDAGPWFRATHVRRQGDDPINLAVLVDLNGDESRLAPKIGEAIGALAPEFLHAEDKISIYGMGCLLMRISAEIPANPAGLIQSGEQAVSLWKENAEHAHGAACREKEHLWDSLLRVVAGMQDRPGRKIILVLSEGEDHGSRSTWSDVRNAADSLSVAIFGVSYRSPFSRRTGTQVQTGMGGRRGLPSQTMEAENLFQSACEFTGGALTWVDQTNLGEKLKTSIQMARERYIVEFPRPSNGTAGSHGLQVRVEKSRDIVRASGVTFPLQDSKLASDPNTIQTGPVDTPQQGKGRVAAKPR